MPHRLVEKWRLLMAGGNEIHVMNSNTVFVLNDGPSVVTVITTDRRVVFQAFDTVLIHDGKELGALEDLLEEGKPTTLGQILQNIKSASGAP